MKQNGTQLNSLFQGQALEFFWWNFRVILKIWWHLKYLFSTIFYFWSGIINLTVQALSFVSPDLCYYLDDVIQWRQITDRRDLKAFSRGTRLWVSKNITTSKNDFKIMVYVLFILFNNNKNIEILSINSILLRACFHSSTF